MMKRRAAVTLSLVLTATALVLASACSSQAPGAPTEVKSPAEARHAALFYVQEQYGQRAPVPGGEWEVKDATPEGLLGRSVVEFTKDDWTVEVSNPVVAPEHIKYDVTLKNTESGWYWHGTVDPEARVTELVPFQEITQENSRKIAEQFVRQRPTFVFDGMEETLVLANTTGTASKTVSEEGASPQKTGWEFTFEFDSRHAGYGDRTGQMLAQVITHHVAVVSVVDLEVTSAIMDGRWDMIQQTESQRFTEAKARQIAEGFVESSPTFVYDGIEETLELVETLYPDMENAWQFVFRFESRHAGYGDRSGQMLAQVITPHEAMIAVERDQVKSAVMDERWNMLRQEMLDS